MAKPAVSVKKFSKKEFDTLDFKGEWKDLLGTPAMGGSWIIYGDSGNGKTTFALKLLKYLLNFKKCAYIPLEEGLFLSFQKALNRENLVSKSAKLKLWEDYRIEDLNKELSKPRAPEFIFLDSLQYVRMNKESVNQITKFEYLELLKQHPTKTFIFISHADKNQPRGALGKDVFYGSHVCLFVESFVIYPKKNRFEGTEPMDINLIK